MAMITNEDIDRALGLVREELQRALVKHGHCFASPHEAMSVIREEEDELWEHVRADTGRTVEAGEEACQVAAMAVKFMLNFDQRVRDGIL